MLADQLVYVTWSCKFIIGRWEVKIYTWFSNWGEAHCASETCETSWCMIRKAISGSRMHNQQQKPGRGPPGTQAPPGQVARDTAKERTRQTTTWYICIKSSSYLHHTFIISSLYLHHIFIMSSSYLPSYLPSYLHHIFIISSTYLHRPLSLSLSLSRSFFSSLYWYFLFEAAGETETAPQCTHLSSCKQPNGLHTQWHPTVFLVTVCNVYHVTTCAPGPKRSRTAAGCQPCATTKGDFSNFFWNYSRAAPATASPRALCYGQQETT